MNSDLIELLSSLNEFKVKYLIIGGYAYGVHAEPRYTKDIDIWIEPTKANAKRLLECLKNFGAPVSSLVEKNFIEPGFLLIFGREPNRVDILNTIDGLAFKDAYKDSICITLENKQIRVISLEHLILLKQIANRPQDKLDLKKLKEIKRRLKS
jgi:predicted nucleotidyltransferase